MTHNDDAVSPVVGVIIMVAIVIILAAIIASFVFGMASDASKNYQTKRVTIQNYDTGDKLFEDVTLVTTDNEVYHISWYVAPFHSPSSGEVLDITYGSNAYIHYWTIISPTTQCPQCTCICNCTGVSP